MTPLSERKKLCFVTASPLTVKAFLRDQIMTLSRHYTVTVVSHVDEGDPALFPDTTIHVKPVSIVRQIAPIRDLSAFLKLWRFFREQDFDAVHSVTPKAGLLAMTAARLARIPVRIHMFTGQVWATKKGLFRWMLKTLDSFTAWQATTVLADSISQREFLIGEGVLTARRSAVLADGSICGVDTRRFRPDPATRMTVRQELGLGEQTPLVLFVGRLNLDKGVLDLAEALPLLPEDPRTVLLFVGPDEAGMRARIQALCSGRQEQLRFVDYTSQPERYMAAADVFCLPSYREGFGSVVIEAASCAVPAVASRIYGLTDSIAEGVTGLLYETRNVRDLAEQLTRLLQAPSLRRAMGAAGRERALRLFTKERLTNALMDLYHGLFGEHND